MKIFLLGAAGLAALVPALAPAAVQQAPVTPYVAPVPPAPPAPLMMRAHSRDEVVAKVREHFARLDTNRDNFLTRQEVEAGRAMGQSRWQRQGIGHALNARRGDPAAAFDRIDTNRDGSISRDEFARAREMRVERRVIKEGKGAGQPGMAGKGMRHHRLGGMMMGGRMFDMADANRDGRVSMQEATDAAVRHFDMADADRNGTVTREERRQIRRQRIDKARTL